MNNNYKNELQNLKKIMQDAERFAKKVPIFKDKIIREKLTGKEDWKCYAKEYKKIDLDWGINRGFYKKGTRRKISNLRKDYEGYFWSIYINSLSLYNSHDEYGLKDICDRCDVYFFDTVNSTFYCTDAQIEKLLEELNSWYIQSAIKAKNDSLNQRIIDKKNQIKKAQEELKTLEE